MPGKDQTHKGCIWLIQCVLNVQKQIRKRLQYVKMTHQMCTAFCSYVIPNILTDVRHIHLSNAASLPEKQQPSVHTQTAPVFQLY